MQSVEKFSKIKHKVVKLLDKNQTLEKKRSNRENDGKKSQNAEKMYQIIQVGTY